jgi:hypothetical protein
MKWAVPLLVLFASQAFAASYAPPSNRYDVVASGRYVYVQLDYEIDEKDWSILPAWYPYKKSGLYVRGRPDKPIWLGSLRLNWWRDSPPIVSDDGRMTAVLRGSTCPRVEFYCNRRQTLAWGLRGPAKPLFRSKTSLGYQPFTHWKVRLGAIEVRSRFGDAYKFLLRDGQMVSRKLADARVPNRAEMDAFEEALAGGE